MRGVCLESVVSLISQLQNLQASRWNLAFDFLTLFAMVTPQGVVVRMTTVDNSISDDVAVADRSISATPLDR